jgi:hypothetical protein
MGSSKNQAAANKIKNVETQSISLVLPTYEVIKL